MTRQIMCLPHSERTSLNSYPRTMLKSHETSTGGDRPVLETHQFPALAKSMNFRISASKHFVMERVAGKIVGFPHTCAPTCTHPHQQVLTQLIKININRMNGKLLHNEILLHINQTSKHLKQHQDTLPMRTESGHLNHCCQKTHNSLERTTH